MSLIDLKLQINHVIHIDKCVIFRNIGIRISLILFLILTDISLINKCKTITDYSIREQND